MTAARGDSRLARAYVDGRMYDSSGWGGIRVAVRVGDQPPVARFLEVNGQDERLARLMGVEEALLLAKELGARAVVVFCDDEWVARRLRENGEVPDHVLPTYLRVAALMNQFRSSAVVHASTAQPAEDARLMAAFGAAEVRILGRPRNLSLFPALT
ncbi:MAG: reverse transcriptase-like protein [Armatimonadota bacterium]